jgi:hypothetical protein
MPDEQITFSVPASATLIGTTVTAVVYSVITTTGELTASATSTGIDLTGTVLGYGTELVAGSIAGNTVRGIAKTYSILAKPAITNSSRIGALGISVIAGTGATLATAALVNGSKLVGSYLYSYYKEYKEKHNPNNEAFIILDDPDNPVEESHDDETTINAS